MKIFRPSWLSFARYIAFVVSTLIATLHCGLHQMSVPCHLLATASVLILGHLFYKRYSKLYVIEKDTIYVRYGILGRKEVRLKLKDILKVEIKQSPFESLLGIGTICFSTAAYGASVAFEGVKNPDGVRNLVENLKASGKWEGSAEKQGSNGS